MKKNKLVFLLIVALVLCTTVVAVLHLTTRESVPSNSLRIECSNTTADISLENLELIAVQGTVKNAKGDVREINAQGLLLSSFLSDAGISSFSKVTAVADDEYSASVSAEEVLAPCQVYLIRQEDGRMQLIVFGDTNSKRNVSNVVRLVVL